MKHFKLWCLILIIFVSLSAIILIGASEDVTRTIASIEEIQAVEANLDTLVSDGGEDIQESANKIATEMERLTEVSTQNVTTTYTRGQEIMTMLEGELNLDELTGLNSEIETLAQSLESDKQELENLAKLVTKAIDEHQKLDAPLEGISDRLAEISAQISQAVTKIEEIESNKAAVVDQVEELLIIAQANEILMLKDTKDDDCVQCKEGQEEKLTEEVEDKIADTEEVIEEVMPMNYSNLGYFSLMMQMQMNMMTMMMQSFSLYFPVQSTTPFSNATYINAPRYDFDIFNNYFGQSTASDEEVDKGEEDKAAPRVKNSQNRKSELSNVNDDDLRAQNSANFDNSNYTYSPSRYSVDTPFSFAVTK